ncbi:TPA: hypothetical protein MDW71_005278 [Klebsiella pneumoniae]|nr:hypothetical protein [Klebsiella pneumoniae]
MERRSILNPTSEQVDLWRKATGSDDTLKEVQKRVLDDSLMTNHKRFFNLIYNYPAISVFWSKPEKSCDVDALKKRMGTMSHSEVVMAKFFMSIWFGEDHGFDIIEAGSCLNDKERKMIATWFLDPFYP